MRFIIEVSVVLLIKFIGIIALQLLMLFVIAISGLAFKILCAPASIVGRSSFVAVVDCGSSGKAVSNLRTLFIIRS